MPYDPIDSIPRFNFWRDGVAAMARNAGELLKLAEEPQTFANLARIVATAPLQYIDLEDDRWQVAYCNQCLKAAHEKSAAAPRFQALVRYFFDYFPSLSRQSQHMLIDGFVGIGMGMEE